MLAISRKMCKLLDGILVLSRFWKRKRNRRKIAAVQFLGKIKFFSESV
jgi:hypothetical protein